MDKLDDKVILRLLREERAKQLEALRGELPTLLAENIDVTANVGGARKKVIAPGLKLRSKGEGKLFTVKAVGAGSAVLLDPNGQAVNVTDQQLAAGYDLD